MTVLKAIRTLNASIIEAKKKPFNLRCCHSVVLGCKINVSRSRRRLHFFSRASLFPHIRATLEGPKKNASGSGSSTPSEAEILMLYSTIIVDFLLYFSARRFIEPDIEETTKKHGKRFDKKNINWCWCWSLCVFFSRKNSLLASVSRLRKQSQKRKKNFLMVCCDVLLLLCFSLALTLPFALWFLFLALLLYMLAWAKKKVEIKSLCIKHKRLPFYNLKVIPFRSRNRRLIVFWGKLSRLEGCLGVASLESYFIRLFNDAD